MAAVNIITKTDIDSGWLTLSAGENRGLYLIAIKGEKTDSDVMPVSDLKQVVVEIGIDSGITGHPIPIQRCVFRFNEYSIDDTVNEKTALSQTSVLPKSGTYIRVVSFSNGYEEKKKGAMPISINMVAI